MSAPEADAAASAALPTSEPIRHNTYHKLVSTPDDLIGHIAYSLYKRDKLTFCEGFRAKRGRDPSSSEVEIFIESVTSRSGGYRTEAEALAERFHEIQLGAALDRLDEEYKDKLLRALSTVKSWRRAVAEALIGNVVIVLIWTLILLAIYANKFGIGHVAKELIDLREGVSGPTAPPSSAASAPASGASR